MRRTTIAELAQRIQGEFREMPGLNLTAQQARRLWDLDEFTCTEILNVLVDLRFLCRTPRGTYARLDAA